MNDECWKFPGNIKISQFCLESNPCQHSVIIEDRHLMMQGNAIYELLQKNNIKSKHFEVYSPQNTLKQQFNLMKSWKVGNIKIGQLCLYGNTLVAGIDNEIREVNISEAKELIKKNPL